MVISRLSLIGIFILISDLLFNVYNKPISLGYYDITAIAFGSCCIIFGVAYDKIHILFKKICEISDSNPYSILCIILIISLLIRILLLPERWINPDEGAHLYDGKLILEGKVPFIDYISRMPVYVYTLAAFLKMFGCNYISGRLLPLFCNIGIGILIFLIGKRLFESNKIALLASTIYLFSPLTILWSVVVKTEPLETLFICTGMFLLLSFIKSEQEKFSLIYFSGFLFALAYYVRRSAIVILAASLLFIIYYYKDDLYKVIRTYGILLLGYSSVVVLIFIFFSSFNGFTATWESTLNPLDSILDPIQKITVASTEITDSTYSMESTTQPFAQTLINWKWILKLNLFLLFGLVMFMLTVVVFYLKKEPNIISKNNKTSIIFLFIWAIGTVTFLIYYSISGSFYTPYFGEIVPALVLLFAYGMKFIASKEKLNQIPLKNIKIVVIIIIIALYISSISLINTSFECVWSPDTVEEISNCIKINSDKGDEIMSGGMIWTLNTNTMIFMNISHPLCYYYSISEDKRKKIKNEMENNKPEFIIFDGYTEEIYFKHIPEMYCILKESYVIKKEVNGSYYPVTIYELKY